MDDEHLLAEVEDLLRTSPPRSAFMKQQDSEEVLGWLGRVGAVLEKWDFTKSVFISGHIRALLAEGPLQMISPPGPAYCGLRTLLFQAQNDLRMKTVGPLSIALDAKKPFAYFDEIRKIIGQAREDLLFVDPYLNTEFVARYLSQVKEGVTIRLLASKEILALVEAVRLFVEEHKRQVQVRSVSSSLHDRFVFVDKTSCYQSGASFKDGARKSPTALIQITIFKEILQTYEDMWSGAETKFG